MYSNTHSKTVFWYKLTLFLPINIGNFVKYEGYLSIYIYIVRASDLFRVLSGNQWNRSKLWEHRSLKECFELIEYSFLMYSITDRCVQKLT